MKICKKCKIEKELLEFYKQKSNKDGLNSLCKNCWNEYQKPYSQKWKKSEASKAQQKEYRKGSVYKNYNKEYLKKKRDFWNTARDRGIAFWKEFKTLNKQ